MAFCKCNPLPQIRKSDLFGGEARDLGNGRLGEVKRAQVRPFFGQKEKVAPVVVEKVTYPQFMYHLE
jgi:hypothetical protein